MRTGEFVVALLRESGEILSFYRATSVVRLRVDTGRVRKDARVWSQGEFDFKISFATSIQARLPAKFKHINKRRKRN
jgi:hypothetical protein